MKKCSIIAFVCVFSMLCYADISFGAADVTKNDQVLFSTTTDIPGTNQYKTLFRKNIVTNSIEQLTFFPEAMEVLRNGSLLQVRNRYGTIRIETESKKISWVEDTLPFRSGGIPSLGRIQDVSTSPDGRYIVSIEAVTPARGRLVLFDTQKLLKYSIQDLVPRGSIPVSWSPDSSLLIYEKNEQLYFSRPESFFSTSALSERFRSLGKGAINSISWYAPGRFLYIAGNIVYRIEAAELLARSLYSQMISIGTLAGKIPCYFNPATDTFSSSPDGSAIVFTQDKRNIYYCPLEGDDYSSTTRPARLPYLLLSGNTASVYPLWNSTGVPIVISASVEDGRRVLKAWSVKETSEGVVFVSLSLSENSRSFSISPLGTYIGFISPEKVSVINTSTWKEVRTFSLEPVANLVWSKDSNLIIGGYETIRTWNLDTGKIDILSLSSVVSAGWSDDEISIVAKTIYSGNYKHREGFLWTGDSASSFRSPLSSNASWRFYLDSSKGFYSNMLFQRSAKNPGGTVPLFSEPMMQDPKALLQKSNNSAISADSIFSHGLRNGQRQVALVFDAMDSLDGLPDILSVLESFKIRATFFINGEFIRRHPSAVSEIVRSGHQCASLFFTTWDLSGINFSIDEDFIIRGLSRNEDDFYNATGSEVSLLWHAPYYVSSPTILSAGKKSGYQLIAPDILVPDWVTEEFSLKMPNFYKTSAEIIEDIVREKQRGSIIPIRVGKPEGTRMDYLYEHIDVLINALLEEGFSIVTVDSLMKNSR